MNNPDISFKNTAPEEIPLQRHAYVSATNVNEQQTLEQIINDLGRSSMGVNSIGRTSLARTNNKVIDLDLNSIGFNTPPREQEVDIEFFQPTEEVSRITTNLAQL